MQLQSGFFDLWVAFEKFSVRFLQIEGLSDRNPYGLVLDTSRFYIQEDFQGKMMPVVDNVPKLRAVLYARISTSNHGQDTEVQLQPLRRVADDRGWEVVAECVDVGVSGTQQERPELDRLMTLIRSRKVDVIAVVRFDRLARSVQHLLTFLEVCRQHEVDFISISESVDTSTPVGRMVFTFLAAVAEFERSLIVERVKAGVAKAQAEGKHCGRPRREFDTRAARILLSEGHALCDVARMLRLPRTTLRRRLEEEGMLVRKSAPGNIPESGE